MKHTLHTAVTVRNMATRARNTKKLGLRFDMRPRIENRYMTVEEHGEPSVQSEFDDSFGETGHEYEGHARNQRAEMRHGANPRRSFILDQRSGAYERVKCGRMPNRVCSGRLLPVRLHSP
jgi:hypothetical protein